MKNVRAFAYSKLSEKNGTANRRACMQKIGKFTKSDLMESCPTIGKTSVENSIKKLVEDGILVRHGTGRAVYYTRSDAE